MLMAFLMVYSFFLPEGGLFIHYIFSRQNVSDCLGSQDFFAGSSVSFGDFSMFHSLLNIQTLFGEEALAAYPSLVAYCTRMKALNGVSEYLSKRNPKPMNLGKGKELFSKM